jgi:hypothetical protein
MNPLCRFLCSAEIASRLRPYSQRNNFFSSAGFSTAYWVPPHKTHPGDACFNIVLNITFGNNSGIGINKQQVIFFRLTAHFISNGRPSQVCRHLLYTIWGSSARCLFLYFCLLIRIIIINPDFIIDAQFICLPGYLHYKVMLTSILKTGMFIESMISVNES